MTTNALPLMDATGSEILESDVQALEDELGTTLPDEYRAFLLGVNGGLPAPSHRVAPFGGDRLVVRDFHSLSASGSPFDLSTRIRILRSAVPYPLIPIGTAAGARRAGTICLCLEGTWRGSVWYFVPGGSLQGPDAVSWLDRPDITFLAEGFGSFIAALRPLAST